MPSLIPELKRDVLDQDIPISSLLRKALIIAKEIGDTENEEWITSELKGYNDCSEIPDYREVTGRPIVRDHYTGWQYVYTQNLTPEQAHSISAFKYDSPIAVIETNAQERILATTYHPKAERMLIEALGGEPRIPAIQFQGTQFQEILAIVRNRILDWINNIPDPPEEQPPAQEPVEPRYTPGGLRNILTENRQWLFQGAGTEVLKWIGAFMIAIITGIGSGYYFTKKQPTQPPKLTSEELKSRIDESTQAHNDRRQRILEAIIKEEHHSTEPIPSTFEIQRTLERLRKELEKEDTAYENELKLLTQLTKE